MNCESVQTWLLQVDTLQPEAWPSDAAEHTRACPNCAKMARDLRQLEEVWRRQPVPAHSERAKAAFLLQLPALHAASKMQSRPWRPIRWAMAAAAILVSASVIPWIAMSPNEIQAAPDLVELLIDWNLDLTSADTIQRQRLLAEKETGFRTDLKKAKLTPEERELAENLLENGLWLATHDDPLAEANLISGIADKLVGCIDSATQKGNDQDTQKSASRYSKVMERGYNPVLDRIEQSKAPEIDKKRSYDSVMRSDQQHHQQLEKVLDRVPERTRQDIGKILESLRNKSFRPPTFHGQR